MGTPSSKKSLEPSYKKKRDDCNNSLRKIKEKLVKKENKDDTMVRRFATSILTWSRLRMKLKKKHIDYLLHKTIRENTNDQNHRI